MTESQQRTVMVALAVVGVAHEIYARQRMVGEVVDGPSTRAERYHAAAVMYGRIAAWFGQQALRAEQAYNEEISQ